MGRRGWSRLGAGASVGAVWMAWAVTAAASSGIDSPESGVLQTGRGSAWLARADDPLAVYFNPAAIAFQPTGVHLGAQLMFMNRCFTRLGSDGKPVSPQLPIPAPVKPGDKPAPDTGSPPSDQLCTGAKPFPNPQLAATFRITDRFALGVAVVAPHASGNNSWPEQLNYTNAFNFATTQPSPQRYLLVSSNALIVYPTLAVAYAPLDNLSFGAAFVWGIATVDFVSFSQSAPTRPAPGSTADNATADIRSELKAKDMFIPGFVLSGLWSPTQRFDIAAWYKWSDALKSAADVHLESLYWTAAGVKNDMVCKGNPQGANCNVTDAKGLGQLKFQIPMEAKLGFRYHHPRQDPERPGWASTPGRKVRDPLSEDLFDLEVNFTWANNSAVDDLQLTFPANKIHIKDGGTNAGTVPANANIPHKWKDVVGVRLGGDFNVIPNRLALRTGGFFETKGQDDAYLNLDFDVAFKAGVAGGATVRVGPVDISVAYQHTFYGTLDNGGKGSVYGLAGANDLCGKDMAPKAGCYRSYLPVNGGILTASLNEVGLSGTVRF